VQYSQNFGASKKRNIEKKSSIHIKDQRRIVQFESWEWPKLDLNVGAMQVLAGGKGEREVAHLETKLCTSDAVLGLGRIAREAGRASPPPVPQLLPNAAFYFSVTSTRDIIGMADPGTELEDTILPAERGYQRTI